MKTRKINKNLTQGCMTRMTGMTDFMNTMFKISLILEMEVKLFKDIHGDSLAVTFYRARTCHYLMMTLCHYDNVII